MRDLALQVAGLGGAAVAIVHGVLGETRVFSTATIEPARMRLLLRFVWLSSALAWAALGLLLALAPAMGSQAARTAVVVAAVVVYAASAAGNAIATRGRHYGWMALAAVVALALAGL